jgi:hypothetical protein
VAGYEWIKSLANELGANLEDVTVLERNNDPFYVGSEQHVVIGRWFAQAWSEKGFAGRGGVHLRRAHYQLLGSATKHDGTPYENTYNDWQYLLSWTLAITLHNKPRRLAFP